MSETFQQFVGAFGDSSWVVLFANAPLDAVSDAYAAVLGREITRNVPVLVSEQELFAPTGTVVQVAGSDWIILFHLVGQWDQFATAAFSQKLKARVLEFSGEDTSGAVECKLFVPEQECTRYQTANDSDDENDLYDEMEDYAESTGIDIAQRPSKAVVIADYDEFFQSLGIQTIKLSLTQDRGVLATAENADRIERVDLLSSHTSAV